MVFNEVPFLEISREAGKYSARIGGETVILPETTNFEFRPSSPLMLQHLYLGNETGGEEWKCTLTFLRPRRVRLTNGLPRCYVHID
jgi:hypothetical protein